MVSGRFADVPVRRVGAVDFSVLTLAEAIARIVRLGTSDAQTAPLQRGVAVHFANAYNVALAADDADYATLLAQGDLVMSDGVPIVWAGRRLHGLDAQAWTRVYGPDVMEGVLAAGAGPRHYLLGGSVDTLRALEDAIAARWPEAAVVGSESPAFRPATRDELAARDARIAASGATLVWVGLGTPKQDVEVRRIADALPVTALAVGAAFDFIAGTVPQAPPWMQRSGLEWAYRLGREPRRLAKRYLWGNPRFVVSVAGQAMDARRGAHEASGRS